MTRLDQQTNGGARNLWRHWLALWLLATALHSCTHVARETYLERGTATKFTRVALHVSSAPVRIRYHGDSASDTGLYVMAASGLFLPLLAVGPAISAAENAVRSSMDERLAAGVRETTSQSYVEAVLARHFLKPFDDVPAMHIVPYASRGDLPGSLGWTPFFDGFRARIS